MNAAAHIGPSISITGEVFAEEPLTIAGQVTGNVAVIGHPLTIAEGATIAAEVVAHTIVVAGNVTGRLNADAKIVVQQSARVEGDVNAPALRVDDGASVEGRIEVTGRRLAPALVA